MARSKPVLIIVMGTSGCGKSTVGAALGHALGAPFIDGDDLHPQANVDKMSRGEPLNDEDRLPWLLSIREKAIAVCNGEVDRQWKQDEEEMERIRRLAEVKETSHQAAKEEQSKDGIIGVATEYKLKSDGGDLESGGAMPGTKGHGRREACVIACSALKKSYRHLLRCGLDVAHGAHKEKDEQDDTLDVYHVYVRVSPEELLRRMHERKGHFMKEGMLRSQLQTLEEPVDEPRTLVLGQADTDTLVRKAKDYFSPILSDM